MKLRRNRQQQKNGERIIPFSPPQTELDSNVRNVLTHLVRFLGTITLPIGPLPEKGYIMWNVGARPDGHQEITIWWAEEDEEEGGNNGTGN